MALSLSSLDPRRHIAAAVGWATGLLSLVAAATAGTIVMLESQSDLERDTTALFASEAARLAEAIDSQLARKEETINSAAVLLGAIQQDVPPNFLQQSMKDAGKTLRGFDWVGVITKEGVVATDSDGSLAGSSVRDRDWFIKAQLSQVVAFGKARAADPDSLIIASPVRDSAGEAIQVLAGRLSLDWLDHAERGTLRLLRMPESTLSAVLATDGSQLAGTWQFEKPDAAALLASLSRRATNDGTPEQSGAYVSGGKLVGFARSRGLTSNPADDWWIVLGQTSSSAFAGALAASWKVFFLVAGAGLFTAVGASVLTSLLLRRLGQVAESARAIGLGRQGAISIPRGRDEIASVGATLAETFGRLQKSNAELQALNTELDRRVEERTREVHRLFEESKNAAVTRERLRLSRDLHDTLAHSMLAVLTQIRLVRKIEKSKPELLSSELAEAERAAQDGLDLARGAVGQLRYVAVRDDGLGPALEKLAKQLRERIEVEVSVDIHPDLYSAASQTAETLHRIAEEALRNIEKYAMPRHVSISADLAQQHPAAGGTVTLTVSDDGVGFVPAAVPPGHYGLLGLREQVQLIGGRLAIDSSPGQGTRIHVEAPIS